MSNYQYLYKNITISGFPGCGSTTLLNLLREELKFDGWTGFSGGEFMRAYAVEKGLFTDNSKVHHDSTAYNEDFDRQVDFGIREKVTKERSWIIESWLSGFMAQNIPHVLKVLMSCSDYAVRVDRVVNRDGVSVDDAKKNINDRYNNNLQKWSRMYSHEWNEWLVKTGKISSSDPIDFWRSDLYDITIDTYACSQQEALNLVLKAIRKN